MPYIFPFYQNNSLEHVLQRHESDYRKDTHTYTDTQLSQKEAWIERIKKRNRNSPEGIATTGIAVGVRQMQVIGVRGTNNLESCLRTFQR